MSEPMTDAPTKTGFCACCGEPTRSLFAMGHDARFRGILARALAQEGWDARVQWHTGVTAVVPVTVTDALAAVEALLERDWREKVEKAASRLPSLRTATSIGAGETVQPLRNWTDEAVDDLIDRLQRNPLVGQWGWYRAPSNRSVRYPARVHRTRRDEGISAIEALIVYPDGSREVLEIQPDNWVRDDEAKS